MAYATSDYIARIIAIKESQCDPHWSEANGRLEMENVYASAGVKPYIQPNNYFLHAVAVLAGQGEATATDITRARLIFDKLTTAPGYSQNCWTTMLDATGGYYHSSIIQPVVESLYLAWKHRVALGLSVAQIDRVAAILTVDRAVPSSIGTGGRSIDPTGTYNTENLAYWQLSWIAAGHMTGLVDLSAWAELCIKRHVAHFSDGAGYYNSQPGAHPDWGYVYPVPNMTRFYSDEYGHQMCGGPMVYYPEMAAAFDLSAAEIAKLQAFQRNHLGKWLRCGYPNWDTGWSHGRLHLLSYWVWSVRELIGMVRAPELCQGGSSNSLAAKFMLDQSLDTMARMDAWNSDPVDNAVSSFPLHTSFGSCYDGPYHETNLKQGSMSRYMAYLATAVDLGVADAPSADPSNLWGYGWHHKYVHVSTPMYSAAHLPYAPDTASADGNDAVQLQSWGVSRIQAPTGEILTAVGGYGLAAFGLRVVRDGVADLDSGVYGSSPDFDSQQVWRDDVLQERASYDTQVVPSTFATSVKTRVVKSGSHYRAEDETAFHDNHIWRSTNIVRTGTPGTCQVIQSIPMLSGATVVFVDQDNAATVLWDGAVAADGPAFSPETCRYIEINWERFGYRLRLTPIAASLGDGAKVGMAAAVGSAFPLRQQEQDRSLYLYLANDAAAMGDLSIIYDIECVEADAVLVEAAAGGRVFTRGGVNFANNIIIKAA